MSDDARHNSDQEIWGKGLANMTAGLMGGLTTATATMRSIANLQCGAKTILATVVHGGVLLALVLGLTPSASYIPMGYLAAILFKVGLRYLGLPCVSRPTSHSHRFQAYLLDRVHPDGMGRLADCRGSGPGPGVLFVCPRYERDGVTSSAGLRGLEPTQEGTRAGTSQKANRSP